MRLSLISRHLFVLAGCLFIASSPTQAQFGYCSTPHAPSTYLRKPSKPFCATSRSCSDWEVQSYKQEVEDYFIKLKRYLSDVDQYYEEAYRYAECMTKFD